MAEPLQTGTVVNLGELEATIQEALAKAKDLRPVFAMIDADLTEHLEEQFRTRGAHLGTPWKAVSPATVELRIRRRMTTERARKKARGNAGADQPLYDQGNLAASYINAGGPGSIRQILADQYLRGSNHTQDGVPVALLHQKGFQSLYAPVFAKRKGGGWAFIRRTTPKRIPARKVIPDAMPAPILKAWEGMVVQYLETGALPE